ncbi:hypothetical protein DMC25_03620 [Caulobacter sp. D4A]|uniref:hypothetical protein n=1 Tax=unclassified Caulobacter TaxID=2648921 RepID=UPI000D72997C|nr:MULTISPECIES: hypothetical protein [unclassified Caulobacter]PXA93454.1 hypothetical protein DMC25_03620 [Caulobacter sp. D4A]PXA96345.1 hypothetical protein DMC18_01665 [Caulobacter sp. D5]
MQAHIYLLTICLPLATVLIIFALRYWSRVAQAKAAHQGGAAQQAVLDGLGEIKVRLSAIEKILKDVE